MLINSEAISTSGSHSTMTENAPSRPPFAFRSREPIRQLNANDVLFGMGTGISQYIGNQRFRDIVEERKEEYNFARKHKMKQKIAEDILDHIHSLGGRFLRRHVTQEPVDDTVEGGTWYNVDNKAALEKCKQALRQRRMPSTADDRALSRLCMNTSLFLPPSAPVSVGISSDTFIGSSDTPVPLLSGVASSHAFSALPSNVWPVLSSTLVGSTIPVSLDANLLLFQENLRANRPYHHLNQALHHPAYTSVLAQAHLSSRRIPGAQSDLSFAGNPAGAMAQRYTAQQHDSPSIQSQHDIPFNMKGNANVVGGKSRDAAATWQEGSIQNGDTGFDNFQGGAIAVADKSEDAVSLGQDNKNHNGIVGVASFPREDSRAAATVDDVSDFLLSILALSGRARFTEQQAIEERECMTNEERAKVLSDLFGMYCSTTHQDKKARRDLDKESIAFLVKQMWVEIEKIPDHEKQALMEAQRVCHAEEFSDARLERFLRCVGMDVQVCLVVHFLDHCLCHNRMTHSLSMPYLACSAALCKLLEESSRSVWAGQVSAAHDSE